MRVLFCVLPAPSTAEGRPACPACPEPGRRVPIRGAFCFLPFSYFHHFRKSPATPELRLLSVTANTSHSDAIPGEDEYAGEKSQNGEPDHENNLAHITGG